MVASDQTPVQPTLAGPAETAGCPMSVPPRCTITSRSPDHCCCSN